MPAFRIFLNRFIKIFTRLVSLACIFFSAFSVAIPPSGIYVLIPPGKEVPHKVLNSISITGVILRGNWPALASQSDIINLDYYHQQMDRAEKAGKVVSLVINNGGVNTPDWVSEKSSSSLFFKNKNKFHDSYDDDIHIPAYWDSNLLREKKRLLSLLAENFSEKKALKLVSIQCANATTDDWNIPVSSNNVSQWLRAGFDDEVMLEACKVLLDHAAKVFPSQDLRMALGRVPRVITSKPDYLAKSIYEYGSENYPERFFIQRHNLFVKTPQPKRVDHLGGWQLNYDAFPFNAAQMLWPVVDEKSCRANAGKKPCNAKSTLKKIIAISRQYGFRYVEVYLSDVLDSRLSEEFSAWSKSFVLPAKISMTSQKYKIPSVFSSKYRPKLKRQIMQVAEDSSYIYGAWSNPVDPYVLNGGAVKHYEYVSALLNKKIGFSIYLPNGTDASVSKLPIIYWLHVKKGNESRGIHLAKYLDDAINIGSIRPAAMVFVNGGLNSFYSNSKDGLHPIEDVIMNELIPHVEERFPVGSERSLRMLEGFSMGGFGALRLAFKYPDSFQSVVTYGGALLSKAFPPNRRDAEAFSEVFGGDIDYFVRNSPEYILSENHQSLNGLGIRIVAGGKDGTRRYNKAMHEQLKALGVSHEYYEIAGVGHAPKQYYDGDNSGSFIFHENIMAKNPKNL